MTLRHREPNPDAYKAGIVGMTKDLRSGPDPFWNRLRQLLRERNVDPESSLLVQLHTEDTAAWLGIVVTTSRAVFLFMYDYLGREIGLGVFREWEELTGQTEHFEYKAFEDQIVCGLNLVRDIQN
jgi:hypothetical protein